MSIDEAANRLHCTVPQIINCLTLGMLDVEGYGVSAASVRRLGKAQREASQSHLPRSL